nr:phage tail protein [Nitrospiraceae bacterium]
PSQWLAQLAAESRSTLVYTAGLWRLNVIPDAAPAPVRTITKDMLAGDKASFTFGKTDWTQIQNCLVASYDRQYSTVPGKSQSGWLGTATAQDAASQDVYGVFKRDIQFEAIRLPSVAHSVLNHMLLEAKNPNLTVEFPVFWENFDLNVGDTIAVSNDIFNGSLFFIEEIKRKDAFRAVVKAVGWWG